MPTPKLFVTLEWHKYEGSLLLGLYRKESGARAAIYEQATGHHDGRLLWWPVDGGGWACQMLVRDFNNSERGVRYRFRSISWEIELRDVTP